MCGIAGIIRFNAPSTADDLAAVRRMADAQVHRGPDGEGIIALGGGVKPQALGAAMIYPLTPNALRG